MFPITLRHEMRPTGVFENPTINPGLNPLLNPPPDLLMFTIRSEAGRHCQRARVEGSGTRFCSDAIAPANTVDPSSASDRPRGLKVRGVVRLRLIEYS